MDYNNVYDLLVAYRKYEDIRIKRDIWRNKGAAMLIVYFCMTESLNRGSNEAWQS